MHFKKKGSMAKENTILNNSESNSKECRICREEESEQNLRTPCDCKGSIKYVHLKCLCDCIQVSKQEICKVCGKQFDIKYIKKGKGFHNFLTNFFSSKQNVIAFLIVIVSTVLCLSLSVESIRKYKNYKLDVLKNGYRVKPILSLGLLLANRSLPSVAIIFMWKIFLERIIILQRINYDFIFIDNE